MKKYAPMSKRSPNAPSGSKFQIEYLNENAVPEKIRKIIEEVKIAISGSDDANSNFLSKLAERFPDSKVKRKENTPIYELPIPDSLPPLKIVWEANRRMLEVTARNTVSRLEMENIFEEGSTQNLNKRSDGNFPPDRLSLRWKNR